MRLRESRRAHQLGHPGETSARVRVGSASNLPPPAKTMTKASAKSPDPSRNTPCRPRSAASGEAVATSAAPEAATKTAPMRDAPETSPRFLERLRVPETTPRELGSAPRTTAVLFAAWNSA